VAILSYIFSNDSETESLKSTLSKSEKKSGKNTFEQTKKIVKCIQEKMKDLKYSFYDSHMDFQQGCEYINQLYLKV